MLPRRRRVDEPDGLSEPPMTPMIDIIFQLLIFFLLTLQFVPLEGKLLASLPKKGDIRGIDHDIDEIRFTLCAGGDVRAHRHDKAAHDTDALQGRPAHLWVESVEFGVLAAGAEDAFRRAAEAGRRMAGEESVIKIDCDGAVPYRDVMGLFNALKRERLGPIEFVRSPRLTAIGRRR